MEIHVSTRDPQKSLGVPPACPGLAWMMVIRLENGKKRDVGHFSALS